MKVKEIKDTSGRVISYVIDNTTCVVPIDGNREYELIKQWLSEGNIPEPEFTDEELTTIELNKKIAYATEYLNSTDWVKDYKLRHDLGIELISESSSKWLIIKQREEYITFLRGAK